MTAENSPRNIGITFVIIQKLMKILKNDFYENMSDNLSVSRVYKMSSRDNRGKDQSIPLLSVTAEHG